jgi:uncharacterized protein YkwD
MRWLLTSTWLCLLAVPAWTAPPEEPPLSKEEKALVEQTNQERTKAEVPVLRVNAKLCAAARAHARNMAQQNKMDHVLDGQTPGDRVKKAGYVYQAVAENIARGQEGPASAVATWMNSPSHKENMLNRRYIELGIGIAQDSQQRKYFVQVFAKPWRE